MIFVFLILLAISAILFYAAQKFSHPTSLVIRLVALMIIGAVVLLYSDMVGLIDIGLL